jgi:hypothetical protein
MRHIKLHIKLLFMSHSRQEHNDFSEAFDKISHKLLLRKLAGLGFVSFLAWVFFDQTRALRAIRSGLQSLMLQDNL